MPSRIELLEEEWIASLRSRGVQPDLSGPFKHKPPRAALKGRGETPAQVLAALAGAQRRALKIGTLRYVEPNPFRVTAVGQD
jgi:hypothetical protein